MENRKYEGFTIWMALVDAIPVVFFGAAMIIIALKFNSALFIAGAILSTVSGLVKVLWKGIVAVSGKDIKPLFVQMRILMPIGFLMIIVSLIINRARISFPTLWDMIKGMPQFIFFIICVLGMCLMMIFAFKLDKDDAKSNWIEQITNGVAQISFFIGILLVVIK